MLLWFLLIKVLSVVKHIVLSCFGGEIGRHEGLKIPWTEIVLTGSIPVRSTNFEVWCNGSTRDFGSLCRGSNPLTSTKRCDNESKIFFKVNCCHRAINELVSILYLGNSIIAVIEFGNADINKIAPYLY